MSYIDLILIKPHHAFEFLLELNYFPKSCLTFINSIAGVIPFLGL